MRHWRWCEPSLLAFRLSTLPSCSRGGAQTPLLGDAYLTLTSALAVEAAEILGARHVVPVHFEHWAHFTQGPETLRDAFARSGIADRLHMPTPGEWLTL